MRRRRSRGVQRSLTVLIPALLVTFSACAAETVARTSTLLERLARLSLPVLLTMSLGVVVILLFVVFLIRIVRRERTMRSRPELSHAKTSRRQASATASANSVWSGADASRSARDTDSKKALGPARSPPTLHRDSTHDTASERNDGGDDLEADSGFLGTPSSGSYTHGASSLFGNRVEAIEVEEVADIDIQAELLLGMGDAAAAAGLLRRHIQDSDRPAPKSWLMLFDLYVRLGREDDYTALASAFRRRYNAEVPSWQTQASEGIKQLDEYPQVLEKVQRLWGMPTCRHFLESLLVDDRGGSRRGFALNAYRDILFLIDIIDILEALRVEQEELPKVEPRPRGNPTP